MKKTGLTSILLIFSGFLAAQGLMTLNDAVEIGLANNYGINVAKKTYQISRNNASPGNAGMLPVVSANAGYVKGLSDVKVNVLTGSELINSSANSDLITAGVNLNWTLFDGLDMFITYDKLKKLEEIGEVGLKIEVENTLAKIITAYYDIIRQEKEVAIMQEQVDISRFRLELARLRFETGSGSEMEYLKAKVELNADSSNLQNQETVYLNSKTTLNELLSRDVNTGFTVRDTILISRMLIYDSLRSSMRMANRNLILANKNKEVSLLDMKSARAQQWPTLDFITTYSYYHSETEANFIQYNRNFGPTVGLTATMKLFDGRNLNRQYKNAKVSLEISDLELNKLENRLEAHLARIYNNYRNEIKLIGFEHENLLLALKNMDIAKESYAVGSISSLQLREIQKDLLFANTRLVNAEFTAKVTETALLLLSGKLIH